LGSPGKALLQPAPPVAVPFSRYLGTWSFPASNGTFKGIKPEFVDLAVHEENGRAMGAFYARFTVAAEADPIVRFDFSGPVVPAKTQRFPLETSDGVKGTVELIPGSGPTLIEIVFHLDGQPGKVQLGDVILVKR